jgi:putative ABC transport system permease protein
MAPMKGRVDEDFAAEIQAHLQIETDRLVEDGMQPHEARLAAERRFGNVARVRERFYESRRWMWLDNLTQDIRGAVRSVARYPVAFAIAVISLGAGIGAATSTLVVRDAVFLAPPPLYAEPEALSSIGVSTPQRARGQVPAGLYRQWLQDEQLAGGLAAGHAPTLRDVRVEERVDSAGVRAVTAGLFSRLGVAPVLGMGFDEWPAESQAPAILSHAAWHRLVGGRSDVVGLPLWIDGQPHTIIGVMPERFWFAAMDGPVWTRLDVATLGADAPLDVVMRRPAEFTQETMAEHLRSGADNYAARQPVGSRDLRVRVDPMAGTPLGQQVGPMVILLLSSAVMLTLLIACTNVAVLMMAQWTTREHEIAIRSSLGGARGRLVRALLTESMLVALAGGLLGVCLTLALRGVLVRNSAFARFFDFSIDPWVWAQCALTTIGAGMLTGIAPALYETRRLDANPLQAIRSGDGVRQRWRHGLVIFEIATTVALLVVTAAMLGSYRRTVNGDPGFDTHPLLNLRVESPAVSIERILEQVRSTSGVIDAEAATVVPYFAAGPQQAVASDAAYGRVLNAERVAAGPRYFATLGVALTAGRAFTDRDVAGAPPVAVVNDVLAAAVWPRASPVGRVAWVDGTPHEIVGVVEGYAHHALRQPRPTIILPLAQEPNEPTRLQILVRTRISLAADTDWLGTPSPFVQSLRRNISALGTGAVRVTTMDQIIAITSQEILVGTYPLAPLILTALLLTAAGIYGVLAFAVTRRATELAVRVAVGATRADVLRLVMRHSVRLLGIGMACGVGATFALTRVAQGRGGMFDSPGWQTFAIPVLVIIVIGVLATVIPMRRAIQIDPARLLRTT